ncbi:hypothetical protein WR25_24645 [Diploscapter pachys]|uniref:Uncharacterized protein n=1 Tax=Diploscapter pachys TaxID=2018661 RepID=A0A2A2K3C0_9BILA|nr:hypothetical protein WR25_24645 [Diploscapter pachys]
MRSPALTSSGVTLPSSAFSPVPAATTSPSCGFSLAVSGMMIPPAVFSSASTRRTRTRQCYKNLALTMRECQRPGYVSRAGDRQEIGGTGTEESRRRFGAARLAGPKSGDLAAACSGAGRGEQRRRGASFRGIERAMRQREGDTAGEIRLALLQ